MSDEGEEKAVTPPQARHDPADLAFIWQYLPPNRKHMDGCAKYVLIQRNEENVWLRSHDLTPAELSFLRAMCKAQEANHLQRLKRARQVAMNKR